MRYLLMFAGIAAVVLSIEVIGGQRLSRLCGLPCAMRGERRYVGYRISQTETCGKVTDDWSRR